MVTLLANANCRRGAVLDYEIVIYLMLGQTVEIGGHNQIGTWWWILVPGTQTHCWVGSEMVQTSGDLIPLTIVESPLLGCWVSKPDSRRNICAVPYPDGAKPGGVCKP
jgi:hypothetical protein